MEYEEFYETMAEKLRDLNRDEYREDIMHIFQDVNRDNLTREEVETFSRIYKTGFLKGELVGIFRSTSAIYDALINNI